MKGNNDEINVVEMLREKTEEADLNKYLKKTLGGYTKKSVLEYLNILRKQQQISQKTFSKNLDDLYNEKDNIKKDNEALLIRYNKLFAEYENLSESLKDIKLDDTNTSAQDYILLKSNIVTLKEDMKKSDREKYTLERKIEQLNSDIDELKLKLNQSSQETKAQKEMLKAEKSESNKQREAVADLSCLLEAEKDEVKFLKGKMTEENFAKLNSKISELTEQLIKQTEVIEKLNSDNYLKDNTIKTLSNEIDILKKNTSNLTKTAEELNTQNNKIMLINESLTYKLSEEYKKSIALIQEKSNITIDKLIFQSKLSDAESYISSLELQISKNEKKDEIRNRNKMQSENNEMLEEALIKQ